MKGIALDDRTTAFAFRGVLFLAMTLMLVHSQRQAHLFELAPFALAAFHLFTSLFLWKAPDRRLNTSLAQSAAFLWDIGVVSCLMYFSEGFDDELYLMFFLIMLLLRFAFFQVIAFFTAAMAERVRGREERVNNLEMRLALEKLANGGWGIRFEDDIHPDVAKSVKSVNAVMDNLARALQRVVAQNDELREAANSALLQLAHEKERLEAQAPSPRTPAK